MVTIMLGSSQKSMIQIKRPASHVIIVYVNVYALVHHFTIYIIGTDITILNPAQNTVTQMILRKK